MKNFKEMLDRDLDTTFYNTKEFAQVKRIKYDGIIKNIPVIFDSEETKERNAQGATMQRVFTGGIRLSESV